MADDQAWQAGSRLGAGIAGFMMGGNPNEPTQSASVGQRFGNAMLSANEGYEKFVEGQKQITNLGKAADYFRAAMGDDAPSKTGITDEEWENMGHKDRASAMQGFLSEQTAQEGSARSQAYSSMAQTRADAQKEQENEAGGLARWAQTMNKLVNPPMDEATGEPMTSDASVMQRFTPEQRAGFQSLADMGQSNPRLAAPMIKSLFQQFAQPGGMGANGQPDNAPGEIELGPNKAPVFYSKKGGQFQVDPAYKASTTADAKAANTPAEEEPGEGPTMSKDGKFYWDTHLKSWKPLSAGGVAGQVQALFGGGAQPAAAPEAKPAELPKISTKADYTKLPSGAIYIGKDGKQYRKP